MLPSDRPFSDTPVHAAVKKLSRRAKLQRNCPYLAVTVHKGIRKTNKFATMVLAFQRLNMWRLAACNREQ
jgi:hypothetical protein